MDGFSELQRTIELAPGGVLAPDATNIIKAPSGSRNMGAGAVWATREAARSRCQQSDFGCCARWAGLDL